MNDANLGEVQGVSNGFVFTQRGLIDVEMFRIPQNKAESFDGSILRFSISENEALNNIVVNLLKLFHKQKNQLHRP